MVKVRLHPHALERLKERGTTQDEVVHTVRHGKPSPAKYSRTMFVHRFAYNKKWLGKLYDFKTIEAFAAAEAGGWLVITVIVKFH